jgi:hypothetical protein
MTACSPASMRWRSRSTNDAPDNASNVASDGAQVTCPECGCQFDPDDVKSEQSAPDSIDDKGAKQPIPDPSPDAQAPIGENAITAALAAMGIHQ